MKFWTPVLSQVDIVEKVLQDPSISFVDVVKHLHALKSCLQEFCTTLPEEAAQKAIELCDAWGIDVDRGLRRKKRMPGESAQEATGSLSAAENVKRAHREALDRLITEIDERSCHLSTYMYNQMFGTLLVPEKFLQMERTERRELCQSVAAFYTSDFNGEEPSNNQLLSTISF